MSRFGYWRDPLFLFASAAYALNRWVLKPRIASPFLHNHFNDLLLIPAALPVILAIQRVLGLRKHDRVPTCSEVIMHWAVWSLVCEWIGPFCFHMGVADIWDVAAYGAGGIVACLWWNRRALLLFTTRGVLSSPSPPLGEKVPGGRMRGWPQLVKTHSKHPMGRP